MREIIVSTAFKKDKKRCRKRNYDFAKLQTFVDMLLSGEPLPPSSRPHKLAGKFEGKWECHIEPDWLLVYWLDDKFVYLARTGTHSDLFD